MEAAGEKDEVRNCDIIIDFSSNDDPCLFLSVVGDKVTRDEDVKLASRRGRRALK